MSLLYPGGKKKAFNISYDDGVLQDETFVNLLNRYGIKGTFNLNSGLMKQQYCWTHPNGFDVKRLGVNQVKNLYDGHEIASHSLTHPYMDGLSEEQIIYQMRLDKETLESWFNREVCGFAAPFDYYSDMIAKCAENCGFEYARMSECTGNFKPCTNWYKWKTGIYHVDRKLSQFVVDFLSTDEELAVCQIVGHSYDLDAENLWGTMELICAAVASRDDIWFCTNLELVRYLKSIDK